MQTTVLRSLLVLLAWLGLATGQASATHLMGGEMTYRYVDANGPATAPFRYEITVTIYTDNVNGLGGGLNSSRPAVEVGIYNRSQGNSRIQMTSVNGPTCSNATGIGVDNINDICIPRGTSVVVLPPTPGGCVIPGGNIPVRVTKYVTIVNLPLSLAGYYAVYSDNARNNDVDNLAQAGATRMTLYTEIAPPLIPNSSPTFADTAVAIICQGDTSLVLNNAVDADGDRLIYSFGTPSAGIIPPVSFTPPPASATYNPNYSVTQPFGPGTGSFASLNASTGLSRYAAPRLGKFVVAVDVREYRRINGIEVLVGVTRRDVQLVSRTCPPNNAPRFTAATLAQRSFTLEEGETISFPLAATDADGNDLSLRASSILLDGSGGYNATFAGQAGTVPTGGGVGNVTVNGTGGNVSGQFRFTARCGDGRPTPYDVSVQVTDLGCGGRSAAEVFQVFVTKAAAPTNILGDTSICDRTTAKTYTAVGPPPSGSYNWRVTGGTIQGSATGNAIQVLWGTSGQGRVTLRNVSAFGCQSDSVTRNIQIQPASTLGVSPNVSICLGQSATLTATGGSGTYTWTAGSQTLTGASITVTPTQTTTYTVSSGAGPCPATRQVTVTVNQTAIANAGSDAALCSNASIQLGSAALPGYTYQWAPATGLSSATAAQPTFSQTLAPGSAPQTFTYTVTATTAAGCIATDQVTVTLNPAAIANAGTDATLCSGTSVQLGAATVQGQTYQWSPATGLSSATTAQPTFSLTNTTGTAQTFTYTVTVTTAAGCTATDQVTVTLNPAAIANAGPARGFCSGTTTQLGTAGLPGYTYQWSPATGLSSATAAQPTVTLTTGTTPTVQTYTVTATSPEGCTATSAVVVTVNPAAVAQAGLDRTFCSGETAQLGNGASAVVGTTYQWSPSTGLTNPSSLTTAVTLTNTGTAPVVQTYTLTATTANGCTATDQVVVTVNPASVANAGLDRTLCSGASVQLGTASLTGYTYQWSPATGLSSATAAQPTFSLTNTGTTVQTFTYTVMATTAEGCTATDQVTVTLNPAAVANAGATRAFCSGASAQLGTAGLAGYTYQWSPATGLSSASDAQPTVTLTNAGTAPQTVTYTVTATTAQGCTATSQVTVTVNPAAIALAGTDRTLCSGGSIQLGTAALPGYTYQWAPATGLSSATAAQPTFSQTLAPGSVPQTFTYTVTATTAEGCTATDQVVVVLNPAAVANAGADAALCSERTTRLGSPALAGYTYQWAPATGLSSATAAQPNFSQTLAPGSAPQTFTYTVTATTAQGCSATDQVMVTVNPQPVTDSIQGSASVCPQVTGVAYSIRNPRNTAYQWRITGGNIVSGQGTPAIVVNWGAASTMAKLEAFQLNQFGCSSDTVVFPVRINQILATQKPAGPLTVCQNSGTSSYSTQFTNGSVYAWQIIGGTQVSTSQGSVVVQWTTPGIGKIVVTETSQPAGGSVRCLGTSDTLFVTVRPTPIARQIAGPARLCVGVAGSYSVPGATGSTYQWTVNNVPQASPTGTLLFSSTTPGVYTLTVRETNAQTCAGPLNTIQVTVDPTPAPLAITGPRSVCTDVNTGLNVAYSVVGQPGSTFQWTVVGGALSSGQNTNNVTVSFTPGATTRTISVTETSQFTCPGAAATINVGLDASSVALNTASVDLVDDRKINVALAVPNNAGNTNQVVIKRRNAGTIDSFVQVGTAANTATTFADNSGVDADARAYEYRVELTNACGRVLGSTQHTTMRLEMINVTPGQRREEGKVTLRWNAYQGMNVARYEVYREADGGGQNLVTTVAATAAATYTTEFASSTAGFAQSFRIKAVEASGNRTAWSNEASAAFENKLEFFNIITPNGDNLNETFTILNVELYPGNTLTILNRWGREVYKTTNYRNTWNAPDQPAGAYYFMFKDANGKVTKGAFEVVK
ncbi:PKD-like domain-containing protein [Hymenobacter koreensis]|uniref:PKD/Chitinase domain-containing protein n=1 Tax=Hymenobacter koreensis TaxID=1084523 RepID=A0ABP8J2U0_9BACT